jgi:hypothetical protein
LDFDSHTADNTHAGATRTIGGKEIVMQQCLGRTQTFRRCKNKGQWRFFCDKHRYQPLVWISFFVFTIVAGLFTIWGGLSKFYYELWPSRPPETAHLHAEVLLRYDGFYVRVVNTGRITATGINVKIVTWRVGAPAADVRQDTPVHNLPPGDENEFQIILTPARFGGDLDTTSLYSGYIVVSSTESSAPQTWAFSIPVDTLSVVAADGHWPLLEIRSDLPKPFLTCVDVPQGICTHGQGQPSPEKMVQFHSNPLLKKAVIERLPVNREKEKLTAEGEVSNLSKPKLSCRENLKNARAFLAIHQWASAANYFYQVSKCIDDSQVDNSELVVAKSHYEHNGFEDAAIAFNHLFSKL